MSPLIVKEVSPTHAHELILKGYLVLDVREPKEVTIVDFDVPRIMHIPLSQIEERYHQIPLNEPVIVVCMFGEASYRASSYLNRLGYKNLIYMIGGLEEWLSLGFPTKDDISMIISLSCCEAN